LSTSNPEITPRLVIRLSPEQEGAEPGYHFTVVQLYTPSDFSISGGERESLEEALEELESIIEASLEYMAAADFVPEIIEAFIHKSLPDPEAIYKRLSGITAIFASVGESPNAPPIERVH